MRTIATLAVYATIRATCLTGALGIGYLLVTYFPADLFIMKGTL